MALLATGLLQVRRKLRVQASEPVVAVQTVWGVRAPLHPDHCSYCAKLRLLRVWSLLRPRPPSPREQCRRDGHRRVITGYPSCAGQPASEGCLVFRSADGPEGIDQRARSRLNCRHIILRPRVRHRILWEAYG